MLSPFTTQKSTAAALSFNITRQSRFIDLVAVSAIGKMIRDENYKPLVIQRQQIISICLKCSYIDLLIFFSWLSVYDGIEKKRENRLVWDVAIFWEGGGGF